MALKILSIVLKIIEIAVLVAGIGLIGYFLKEEKDSASSFPVDPYDMGYYGRYEFYLYAASVGVIVAIVGLVAIIAGVCERNGGALTMFAVHVLLALQLLISSALLAKLLVTAEEDKIAGQKITPCDLIDDEDYNCKHIMGGVVCGFIGFILFLVDTIIFFIQYFKRSAVE